MELRVGVKTLAGTVVDVEVELTDTVADLKARMLDIEGITLEQQTYFFRNGGSAKDDDALVHLENGICRSVFLVAAWSILLTWPRGGWSKEHVASVGWNDRISHIRAEVLSNLGLPRDAPIRLQYAGWTLHDGGTLGSYYIPSGSTIYVLVA